jgi:PAS domain S-box-containing protein
MSSLRWDDFRVDPPALPFRLERLVSGAVIVAFTLTMLYIALGAVRRPGPDADLARVLVAGGTVLCLLTLVSAPPQRRFWRYGFAAGLAVIGATLMAAALHSGLALGSDDGSLAIARRLRLPSGSIVATAMMGLIFVGAFVAGHLMTARQFWVKLGAFSFLRLGVVAASLWQFAYSAFDGRVSRLVDSPWAAAWQILNIVQFVVFAAWLLHGDRRWALTMVRDDGRLPVVRFIVVLATLPLGFGLWATLLFKGAFHNDVPAVLVVQQCSVVIAVAVLAVLRQVWRQRRARESLSQAVSASPILVRSVEPGPAVFWSRAAEKLYGYSADEARAVDDIHGLLRTRFPDSSEQRDAALKRARAWHGRLIQRRKSGEEVLVEARWELVDDDLEHFPRIVETMTDITDLERARADLTQSVQKFAAAAEVFELGSIEWDLPDEQAILSPRLLQICGLGDDAEPRRAPISLFNNLVFEEDLKVIVADLWKDVATRSDRRSVECRIRRPNGEVRYLSGVVRLYFDRPGVLKRVVAVYRDVTDRTLIRIKAEDQAARLPALEREINRRTRVSELSEFAAHMAHELNQPLTAVGNSVGAVGMLIREGALSLDAAQLARVRRAAHHAEEQANRAGEIIRRLRNSTSTSDPDLHPECLEVLVEEALVLAKPILDQDGVEVRKVQHGEGHRVLADRIQIQQVLFNLFRNSAEAIREKGVPGVLTVTVAAEGARAYVEVQDNGPGLSAEAMAKLFMPFTSSKRDGMGIGLSFCRRVMEMHSGGLTAETSLPGEGARFVLSLPVHGYSRSEGEPCSAEAMDGL